MAWNSSRLSFAESSLPGAPLLLSLMQPSEALLTEGGDTRLALSFPARENGYGCSPFPKHGLIDFASSTASSISAQGYARVKAAQSELLALCLHDGAEAASQTVVAAARGRLLAHLKLEDSGTEVIFAPSGTDAQLHALFLARSLCPGPLTAIVVGADQTGSGTAYTCKGRHFSQITARGWEVAKGSSIAGLGEKLEGVEIGFCKPGGSFRRPAEMDEAVLAAVEIAIRRGRSVLLQAMDASKFGWRAPSDACLDHIASRWPDRVRIVMDACQLRLSRERLRALLAKGHCVLVTGSKFFTGPAFSGALLVPAAVAGPMSRTSAFPGDLCFYATRYDWPETWALRGHFPDALNLGQWLRWEAALEEMKLYYAVPKTFRDGLVRHFGAALHALIRSCSALSLLPQGPAATIFAVTLRKDEGLLPADAVTAIYRALRKDISEMGGKDFATPCQLGQPVLLPGQDAAALRISLSARAIRDCWSYTDAQRERRMAQLIEDLSLAVGKLDWLARNAEHPAALS